jgi:hypothetical protein
MKNKFFEKAYLMQDDFLLATFYLMSSESFSLRYIYEAEAGFAKFRLALEQIAQSKDQEQAYQELFQGIWLIDAETFEVSRDFLITVNDEVAYVRPRIFASTFELRRQDELLAKLSSCDEVADRKWMYVCKFHPNRGFNKYKGLFLEASALIDSKENPRRVQKIYEQLHREEVVLTEFRRDSEGKQYTNFRLRFNDDRVYICIFDCA